MPNGVSLVTQTLIRLRIACEAMGIQPSDIRPEDFGKYDQERWAKMAERDLRDFINEDQPSVQSPDRVLSLHEAITKRRSA